MSEYTYADVIIDPKDERVKIGEKYYFGDNPNELIKLANSDSIQPAKLIRVDYGDDCPFIVFNEELNQEVLYGCLIKAKELQEKPKATTNLELIQTMCLEDFNKFLWWFKITCLCNFMEKGGAGCMNAIEQKEWLESENHELLFKLMRTGEEE